MQGRREAKTGAVRKALLAGVALSAILAGAIGSAGAQSLPAAPDAQVSVPKDARLLLSSNELVFDNDTRVVVARGAVRIDYGGYKMVADRVEYDQKTGRMKAFGNVELLEPDGNRIYTDQLDVTDDFADGFVNELRIETTDNTRIVADSAVRRGATETQFNNGVYTACEPCKEHPERAPFWQVKARRVVQNSQTHTIRLESAQMEIFGVPVAFLPAITVPDQTVKRKSGFLQPSFGYSQELGASVGVPYYQVISPYMDATVTGTGYTNQGFLAEGEFRQRFRNGQYKVRVAAIDQQNPEAFGANTQDSQETTRAMIATDGQFQLNRRWTFGWNLFAQTDSDFARTYDIKDYSGTTITSQAYLTGLDGRNYFDLHGYYFDDQNASKTYRGEDQQPFVAPVIDYSYTPGEPVLGGELNFDANFTSLSRDLVALQYSGANARPDIYRGLEGRDSRLSSELEWRRSFIVPGGLVLTPMAALRGDAFFVDVDAPTNYITQTTTDFTSSGTDTRYMATAGLEARYPILVTTAHSSHVIEPIAQVFARPDEPMAGGLPNEDAQSFVFDATSLFERDKFSGYDRVEGGTRANVGLRYTGSFDNGTTLQAVAGQSFQLAGLNSFATPDLVYAGADSGLETDASDYVSSLGITLPVGLSLAAGNRFDNDTFAVQRSDVSAGYRNSIITTNLTYSDIEAQPTYGTSFDRREVSGNGSLRVAENWRVFGNVTYDLVNDEVTRDGIGFGYNNECFVFTLVYQRDYKDTSANATDWSIGATLSFRTLGDLQIGSSAFDNNNTGL